MEEPMALDVNAPTRSTFLTELSEKSPEIIASLIIDLRQTIQRLEAENRQLKAAMSLSIPSGSDPENSSSGGNVSNKSDIQPSAKRQRPNASLVTPPNSSSSSSSSEDKVSSKRPPPIRITQKEEWPKIHNLIQENGIPIRSAKNASDCVIVYPEDVEGFRSLTKHLDTGEVKYKTHQLSQDKELVVVIRGVHESYEEDAVLAELKHQVPDAVSRVHRMGKGSLKWPLVAVHLNPAAPNAKSIFEVSSLFGLKVTVEPKRKSNVIPQCKRCQKFFHTHNYCHVAWVCAFCSKAHETEKCTIKDKEGKQPCCANCKGPHRATYRGCPKAPKKTINQPQAAQVPPPPVSSPPKSRPVRPSVSYSQIAASNTVNPSLQLNQKPSIEASLQLIVTQFVSSIAAIVRSHNG